MTPDRARWVIVTRVERPEVYPALQRSFAGSPWVEVVVDRRRGERRHGTAQGADDQPVQQRGDRERQYRGIDNHLYPAILPFSRGQRKNRHDCRFGRENYAEHNQRNSHQKFAKARLGPHFSFVSQDQRTI